MRVGIESRAYEYYNPYTTYINDIGERVGDRFIFAKKRFKKDNESKGKDSNEKDLIIFPSGESLTKKIFGEETDNFVSYITKDGIIRLDPTIPFKKNFNEDSLAVDKININSYLVEKGESYVTTTANNASYFHNSNLFEMFKLIKDNKGYDTRIIGNYYLNSGSSQRISHVQYIKDFLFRTTSVKEEAFRLAKNYHKKENGICVPCGSTNNSLPENVKNLLNYDPKDTFIASSNSDLIKLYADPSGFPNSKIVLNFRLDFELSDCFNEPLTIHDLDDDILNEFSSMIKFASHKAVESLPNFYQNLVVSPSFKNTKKNGHFNISLGLGDSQGGFEISGAYVVSSFTPFSDLKKDENKDVFAPFDFIPYLKESFEKNYAIL